MVVSRLCVLSCTYDLSTRDPLGPLCWCGARVKARISKKRLGRPSGFRPRQNRRADRGQACWCRVRPYSICGPLSSFWTRRGRLGGTRERRWRCTGSTGPSGRASTGRGATALGRKTRGNVLYLLRGSSDDGWGRMGAAGRARRGSRRKGWEEKLRRRSARAGVLGSWSHISLGRGRWAEQRRATPTKTARQRSLRSHHSPRLPSPRISSMYRQTATRRIERQTARPRRHLRATLRRPQPCPLPTAQPPLRLTLHPTS